MSHRSVFHSYLSVYLLSYVLYPFLIHYILPFCPFSPLYLSCIHSVFQIHSPCPLYFLCFLFLSRAPHPHDQHHAKTLMTAHSASSTMLLHARSRELFLFFFIKPFGQALSPSLRFIGCYRSRNFSMN